MTCFPLSVNFLSCNYHLQNFLELNDLFHNYAVLFEPRTQYLASAINSKEFVRPHVALPGQADEARDSCDNVDPSCSPEQVREESNCLLAARE